jgi:hypothetical protein
MVSRRFLRSAPGALLIAAGCMRFGLDIVAGIRE